MRNLTELATMAIRPEAALLSADEMDQVESLRQDDVLPFCERYVGQATREDDLKYVKNNLAHAGETDAFDLDIYNVRHEGDERYVLAISKDDKRVLVYDIYGRLIFTDGNFEDDCASRERADVLAVLLTDDDPKATKALVTYLRSLEN